jgi:tRNA(fMet)-specific endonuclease VapC
LSAYLIAPLPDGGITCKTLEPAVAVTYGKIRAALKAAGRPIGPLDTLIAAHAVTPGVSLVTNNEREFRRVKGLHVENWLE